MPGPFSPMTIPEYGSHAETPDQKWKRIQTAIHLKEDQRVDLFELYKKGEITREKWIADTQAVTDQLHALWDEQISTSTGL